LNLPDTEAALAHFWETCFEGGSRCALYRDSDTGPDDIRGRVEAFMDDLDENPATYITEHDATIITKEDILHLIFRPLYFPQVRFPGLAATLANAMEGNFTGVYENTDKPALAKSCGPQQTDDYTWQDEVQSSILCGDGPSLNETTAAEFAEYVARLTEDSPHFGPLWSRVRIRCSGWKIRPKYRFTGPWTTPDPDASLVEGKPAAPILFVSSTIDPVTPLSNARRAMAGHPGSALLAQESVGHGALFVPSRCREAAIARYFATGEVPAEPETLCQADCRPFQPECEGLEPVVATLEASERRRRNDFGPLAIHW
jgi:hypothetical protein